MLRLSLALILTVSWVSPFAAGQRPAADQPQSQQAAPIKAAPGGSAGSGESSDARPDYSREGVIFEKIATTYNYNSDGTGVRTLEVAALLQSDAAVHQFGVVTFGYAQGNERVSLDYLRVRKPDGSVVDTPATDAQDLPTDVTRIAPLYSDLRELQVPVKSLVPGDRLEYRIRSDLKEPLAPDQFWGSDSWVTTNVALDESVELSFPTSKHVLVLSPSSTPQIQQQGGRTIYLWHSSQLKPTSSEKEPSADPDALPDLAWTTFRSWDEIGDWYRTLARDRAVVTPEIQSTVEKVLHGKTTDDDRIEAIYDYVSLQIRYVGIDFGIGRYQPHAAQTVLDNRYGDCKDKTTLLVTMLKAAGYDAWPALIGSAKKLHLEFPSPAQFDHVITVVPRGDQMIWLDTTPEVAPWRMLLYPLRGKQALAIPTSGNAKLVTTPADGPFPFSVNYTATAGLDSAGTLTGHIVFTSRGDAGVAFRSAYRATPRAQWQQLSQTISQAMGYAGTVSNVDVSPPEQTREPFKMAWDYDRKDYSDWDNHRILPLMTGIALTASGDSAQHLRLGARQVESFHSEIVLPPGYTADVPAPVRYDSPFATYQTTYKLDGDKLITDRRFELLRQEVSIDEWKQYKEFADKVNADVWDFIPLTLLPSSNVSLAGAPESSSAQALIQAAQSEFQYGDYSAARRLLDQAAKINPKEPGLWAAFEQADMQQGHFDAVASDVHSELAARPESLGNARSVAEILIQIKQTETALAVLRELLRVAPGDARSAIEAGNLLLQKKQYNEAATLLDAAHKTNPKDPNLAIAWAGSSILAGSSDDAIGMMRASYKAAENIEVLAGAARDLADKDVELNLAEQIARRADDLAEAQSARIKLASIDNDGMKIMQLLAQTWDTLGWIYFEQSKLDTALGYARPAFETEQTTTAGYHLGRIYEKQGRLLQALGTYTTAEDIFSFPPEPGAKEACSERRKILLTKPLPASSTSFTPLPNLTLPLLGTGNRHAEFLVTIYQGRIVETRFVRGDEKLKAADPMLRKADLSAWVPPGSTAHLVRDGDLSCAEIMKHCQFTMMRAGDRVPW